MASNTSIQLALWVLRRPNNEQSDVLLIDASEVEDAEKHVAQWLKDPTALAEVPHVRVSVDDLVNDDAQLTPKRWLATEEPSVDEVHAAYVDASTAIREATQALGEESGRVTFTQDSPRESSPSRTSSVKVSSNVSDIAHHATSAMTSRRPWWEHGQSTPAPFPTRPQRTCSRMVWS
jgi:hypothetical protein